MKNINILAILLCLFVSCSNHSSIKMNENCGRQPDLVEQTVKFDLINQSMTSTFNIIKYETDSIKAERVTNVNVDEDLLQFFMKYCASKNIVFEDPVMAFVVYTNSIVSESMLVKEEQIKAVSAYTVKRNKIIHHLYLQDNNKNFYEEENVKVSVPWIVSNHITFYIQNYVFPDNRNNSAIIINGELASKVWKNLDRYWTSMKYEVNPRPKTQVRTIITPPGGSSTGCGSDPGCEVGTWNMICMMIITGEYACALADGPLSPCPATELSYYDGPFIDIYDRGLM